ncbi:MAG: hypothetical protein U0Q15_06295 [Kineosporiaceae bacterium]
MRIARATAVALTAFLASCLGLGLLAIFVVVAYTGMGVGSALMCSALPIVILATTIAVLQAQRSLGNSDWRQAVMAVPETKLRATAQGEYTGLLPASHWAMPEPSPQEEQLEGMKAQLPYWSSEPVQSWTGPRTESSAVPLPKRRMAGGEDGSEGDPAGSRAGAGVTTLVLPAGTDEEALAAAVAEALRSTGPLTWEPTTPA